MSAIASASSTNPQNGADPFSAFTSGQFLELIFTELTNQDPLAPNETKDLIEQISTIRSIESDTQLTNKFEDLLRQNDLTVSSSLIGKFVTGLDENDFRVASFVDSVSITRTGTILNLSDGTRVPIDQVDEVIDPALISFTEPDEPELVEGAGDETPAG
ncbi:MAG: flagellar hook capping FlgD N-terminal domain-containing protein [Phycisphaerales bacterium]